MQLSMNIMQTDMETIQIEIGEPSYLAAARRAPSAHNAQPWRLYRQADSSYLLGYAYADRLFSDPGGRDAILSTGAFYETLAMAASLEGKQAIFEPQVVQHAHWLQLGHIHLKSLPGKGEPDPLAPFLTLRQTNRHPYDYLPLSPRLRRDLLNLGCVLIEPEAVAPLVGKASTMAWKDAFFVSDLKKWVRFQEDAPDGLTCTCLELTWLERQALHFALWAGSLSTPLAWVYARRDVMLTHHSAAIAVLAAENREPLTLFECGRRLLRSWVTINAAAYSYHPISMVINQPTVTELAQMAGVSEPVAVFRVGYTFESTARSNRRGPDGLTR